MNLQVIKKRQKWIPEIVNIYEAMGNPIPEIITQNAGRLAFMSSHLASGSLYDYQFAGECRRRGFVPCWDTFEDDTFFSGNSRKLAYLHISDQFGNLTKLANAGKWNGRKLSEIVLDSGQSLVEFHREKWQKIPGEKLRVDLSSWLQFFGRAEDYYYHVMVLYSFFGPWISPHYLGYRPGERERLEMKAIAPAMEKIREEYGLDPLILKFNLKPQLY